MKDYFGYAGQVCVVTGAASGMGKATAEMLVDLGAEVYGLDRNPVEIPGMKKFVQVNLDDPASIDAAFAQLPAVIHKFFGIAGVSGAKNTFNEVYIINFISNKYMTEKYLIDRVPDGGAVAYMSSQAGAVWKGYKEEFTDITDCDEGWDECVRRLEAKGGVAPLGAYGLSKRSLTYYAKKMADELGHREVRFNVVSPCNTITGLIDEFRGYSGSYEASKAMWGSIKREATAQEMANCIVFLNSQMATIVSGCDLAADGASRSTIDIGRRPDISDHGCLEGLDWKKRSEKVVAEVEK